MKPTTFFEAIFCKILNYTWNQKLDLQLSPSGLWRLFLLPKYLHISCMGSSIKYVRKIFRKTNNSNPLIRTWIGWICNMWIILNIWILICFIAFACITRRFAIAFIAVFLVLLLVADFGRTDKSYSLNVSSISSLGVCD